MYSRQLEIFLKVAELGSFSKAAEAMYLTPSAVIQQMNNMEHEIGTSLLVRTKHGTSLTDVGELYYKKGKEVMRISEETRREISAMLTSQQHEITVGTSMLSKCQLMFDLWLRFQRESNMEDYSIRLLDITNNEKRHSGIDLQEGINIGSDWLNTSGFLELCKTPVVCAVPKNHPLSSKSILTYKDIRGETLVTVKSGVSREIDRVREEAENHGAIIKEVDIYDLSVFGVCIMNGYLLQIPACWRNVHSDMISIPCEWEYFHAYGIYYQLPPSEPVQKFLDFVKQMCKREKFSV